jgi:hypothetical protein
MSLKLDLPFRLPGQQPVNWSRSRGRLIAAGVAAVCWPPLVLTMVIWRPLNWIPGRETDWRLMLLVLGAVAIPLGLRLLKIERERSGRPATRLGIVWRFMFYGGLLAAGLQALMAVIVMVLGLFEAGTVWQAMGATETNLLIYGVLMLPPAIVVGVSYALWAGLCVAYLAFEHAPEIPDRLGVLSPAADAGPRT